MTSTHKSDYGEFKWTAGAFYGDAEKNKGINMNTLFRSVHLWESLLALFQEFRPARMPSSIYARSASFSNEGKTLVIQFTVKHEQKIDCGGGYVKVSGGLLSLYLISLSLSPSYVSIYLSLSITLSLSLS